MVIDMVSLAFKRRVVKHSDVQRDIFGSSGRGRGPDAADMDGVYGRLSGLWSVEEEKPGEKGTAAAAGRAAGIGIFCFVVFFPGEESRNRGVGGMYAVVL